MLGAGVYVLAGEIAGIAGGALWVPLVAALLLALLTAGSYAELATTRAFGPFAGFLVGYCMLSAGIVSVGALALGFAGDYLGAFVSLPAVLVVVVFLALLAALNTRGISESLGANRVLARVLPGRRCSQASSHGGGAGPVSSPTPAPPEAQAPAGNRSQTRWLPSRAMISPGATSRSMWSTAVTGPKRTTMSRTDRPAALTVRSLPRAGAVRPAA